MLVIRLRQQGASNRQTFRLVVTDKRGPRDGKYLEKLGWYDPSMESTQGLHIDVSRLQYWLDTGAQMSDRAKALVNRFAPEVVQQLVVKTIARTAKARMKRKQKKK